MSTALAASVDASAAAGLLRSLDGGVMDPTAYDTAWVARLVERGNPRRALFPQCAEWLLGAQHADGSWGAAPETLHDRVAATLAAMTALEGLVRRDVPLSEPGEAVHRRVQAGLGYLARRAADLAADPWETVGFELAVPVLLIEARDLGLTLPWERFAFVAERRAAKLARLPRGWQGQVGATMVHTLEGWGSEVGTQFPSLRAADGSCANSPSATAFYYSRLPDETARAYLQECVRRGAGGVADVYPFDIFEAAWVLDHFALGGVPARGRAVTALLRRLAAAWEAGGGAVGIASAGLEPDADDTALAGVVLFRAGHPVHAGALAAFRRPGGFACFPFERNPSVSANIHAAYAIQTLPFPDREGALAVIRDFLADARHSGGYWTDKWHASPWYATCRAVATLGGRWPDLLAPAVDWLLDGQRADGSWGFFGGTVEETAYAVEALAQVRGVRRRAARRAISRARPYLLGVSPEPRPALWIGKGLYHPRAVVEAAVQAALRLSARAGGDRP